MLLDLKKLGNLHIIFVLKIKSFPQYSKIISVAFWTIVLINVGPITTLFPKVSCILNKLFIYLNHLLWEQLRLQEIGEAYYNPYFSLVRTVYATIIFCYNSNLK